MRALDANNALLLTLDENKNDLRVKIALGMKPVYSEEVVSWVVTNKRSLAISRLDKTFGRQTPTTAVELPLVCVPLLLENKIIGVVYLSGKKEEVNFEEDEVSTLSNISSQMVLAYANPQLHRDNEKVYLESIIALALATEAQNVYSRGHSNRVCEYAVKIARKLGLSEEKIKTIETCAHLHDIGKIGISEDILKKFEALNDVERRIIEQHPVIGEGIILPLHGVEYLKEPIRHHHERLNGQGYPDHLKDEQISLEARILGVADSFDAMTTDRPYRKAKTFQQAKEQLLKEVDTFYDREVVEALIEVV